MWIYEVNLWTLMRMSWHLMSRLSRYRGNELIASATLYLISARAPCQAIILDRSFCDMKKSFGARRVPRKIGGDEDDEASTRASPTTTAPSSDSGTKFTHDA